ncbi:SGNH/GDSL hydrolase family protein [Noviherbaspirillum saxi]|uniref:Phospholipase/lecithinase/hemolysin n=1 Tax=Noviherbaspirillum saxi TaxID=2320863 RepID=A0A3A3FF38_9BURK|nr:SGNH/GDSL hydrolase family protein [Noviherbaspirillum saxi]RJF91860.1 hypothetical protein D3871_24590 [Noviherbaspirillum saxi]
MQITKFTASLLAAAVLAGCGGDNTPHFSSMVTFGDSLSDVGSYAVGNIKTLGGGKFTVNAPDAQNWTEVMANRLHALAQCAAQTGLEGDAALGYAAPITNHPNCTNYAQGGARVTNPIGSGNKATGTASPVRGMTVPVVTQIQNHLAKNNGSFNGSEIVFVHAGGNDVGAALVSLAAGTAPATVLTAVGTAGAELAGYVKNQIVGKGAKYVVVINVPDVSKFPFGLVQSAQAQGLMNTLVTTFNAQLQAGLAGTDVVQVDFYSISRDQAANPAKYGITSATTPACDLSPAKNPLGHVLVCTKANVIPGAIDNLLFADAGHYTPFGYKLMADMVSAELAKRDLM